MWAFATPETTVYRTQSGRGFPQAAVLDANYDGVLVRDRWAPYRRFTAAAHQTCLAHLLRRCRDLMRDHPRAPFAARVKALLQHALDIRDRRAAGTISTHGADPRRLYPTSLTTLLRTAQQRLVDAADVLVELLRSPQPTVSKALAPHTRGSSR